MRTTIYNRRIPWASAVSSFEAMRGLEEMLAVYSPFGQVRNVLSSFRAGIGIGGFQGSATPMPSLNLSDLRQEHAPAERGLKQIFQYCEKYDLNPIYWDFTPEGFSQIEINKVFIPELVPAFPPNLPMLGHKRYRTIRQKLGISDDEWDLSDMPTDPLPYP